MLGLIEDNAHSKNRIQSIIYLEFRHHKFISDPFPNHLNLCLLQVVESIFFITIIHTFEQQNNNLPRTLESLTSIRKIRIHLKFNSKKRKKKHQSKQNKRFFSLLDFERFLPHHFFDTEEHTVIQQESHKLTRYHKT